MKLTLNLLTFIEFLFECQVLPQSLISCILLVFLVCKMYDLELGCVVFSLLSNGLCSMGMNFSGEVRKRV